jgi:hypothetical protein
MNQIPLCGLFALEEAMDLLYYRLHDEERKEERKKWKVKTKKKRREEGRKKE